LAFGGVVAVTLKTEALSQLLAKLRLGPSGVAVLRGFDMTQIARHPHLEGVGMGAGNKTVSQALRSASASGRLAARISAPRRWMASGASTPIARSRTTPSS
jgi:hypothetical protein